MTGSVGNLIKYSKAYVHYISINRIGMLINFILPLNLKNLFYHYLMHACQMDGCNITIKLRSVSVILGVNILTLPIVDSTCVLARQIIALKRNETKRDPTYEIQIFFSGVLVRF